MKNMKCKNCALKHIAAAISYGKEIMSGHTKGAELDHRPDFLGELVNAEHHLKLLDARGYNIIINLRRKLQKLDHIPSMADIEYLRHIWLLTDKLETTEGNKTQSRPCGPCKGAKKIVTTPTETADGAPPLLGPLVAITCTGDRPEQFAICHQLMTRQNLKPDMWIIVDDGKESLQKDGLPEYAHYIRRTPLANDPAHTLVPNLKIALRYVQPNARVVFIEDDDFYPADWLERASDALLAVDLAGCDSRYYQLGENRWKIFAEEKSVLANTALKGRALRTLRQVIARNNAWDVDMRLWKTFTGKKDNKILEVKNKLHPVGLKMWKTGRPGQTKSWKSRENFIDDPDRTKLKEWAGNDIAFYL